MLPDLLWLTALGVVLMSPEGLGTWRHGGYVGSCVGFLENKELTPVHAGVVEKFFFASQKEHAAELHAL